MAVNPEAGTWQTLGLRGDSDWLTPETLARPPRAKSPPRPIDTTLLLAPVVPRCIVGVGLNYRAHAAEQGKPLPDTPPLFLKHPRSLAAPFGALPLQPASAQLDYEAELGIVIGRAVFDCSRSEAAAAIAGWVIVQDYTLRDLARPEMLAIAKGGRGMAPIGPWLTTVDDVTLEDAGNLSIRCRVNGELRQDAGTADMHVGPAQLVHHVARHLPLGPGDIIATGSPAGSGVGMIPQRWLAPGDIVDTEITGLGRLRQQVTAPA
ncbi:fumarylacetoacetate hydrolase family protein [Erythrobacter sp. NFXS35]|uniref:fumarylacetoacetate hydrolase family protein n=1 Tax=Erythrobacter sp. NFXS35 TaxID=2818436 RepID=UPI0032DEED59